MALTNLPKVKIMPSTVPTEFVWICSRCRNLNTMLKRDLGSNHAYSCWDCHYTWALGVIPDDIRHFMASSTGLGTINQRPRIVREL